MADISQVKLPDGTTYNLKDSYVRTNYRALNNNDFDTINVTELNAGDLIVTGAARFLNTINGSISGNAVTATKATQDGSGNTITSTYLPLAGGTMTGDLLFANSGTNLRQIRGTNGDSDAWRIAAGAIAANSGWLEIATADDYNEPIYVRQYKYADASNAFGTVQHEAVLLDANGNTSFPKNVTAIKFIGALQGNADTASKLGTSTVGSATQPIYLSGGTAIACTYTLGKSVPSDAVFTDHYAWSDITGKPITFATNISSLATNGWKTLGGTTSGKKITISYASSTPATWNSEQYSSTLLFGCQDTKGFIDCGYINPIVSFGGSSNGGATDNDPKWYFKITGTNATTYNLDSITNGNARDNTKVAKSGDTMNGALNFANSTKNSVGDDAAIGDFNIAGTLGVQGLNGATGIGLIKQGETWGTGANYAKIGYDGTTVSINKPLSITGGAITASTYISATTYVNANTANSGTAGGLSLYGATTSYGITMRNTGTSSGQLGKHGYVQGDWAGYLCFDGAVNRGWIFRQASTNVASISGEGHAAFNGSVTIGANTTNTSGVRQVYNSTTKSLDFVFVA